MADKNIRKTDKANGPASNIEADAPPAEPPASLPSPKVGEGFNFDKILSFLRTKEGWATAAAITSAIVAIAGGSYTLGKDTGASELAVYKTTESLGLKELTTQTAAATKELRHASTEFAELVNANKNLKVISETLTKTKVERDAMQAERDVAVRSMSSLKTDYVLLGEKYAKLLDPNSTIKVSLNKSVALLGGDLIIGLVNTAAPKATLNVNNSQAARTAGDTFPISLPGPPKRDCKITLMEIGSSDVTIAALCVTPAAPAPAPPAPPAALQQLNPLGVEIQRIPRLGTF